MSKKLFAVFIAVALVSCQQQPKETAETKEPISTRDELIKRGKYLTTIGACHDCHSPKVMTSEGPMPDTTRLLSGHPMNDPTPPLIKTNDWILFSSGLTAFSGPWGVSYSANLTPDETGTGNWSFEQFKVAIRQGKSKGLVNNRPLLPPMPWQMYRNFTDDDLLAVFTYLHSLPPVKNIVPAPLSPEELNRLASK